jgi:hypothetical protein
MKARTASTYGKRRVYTRLAHMIDPLLLVAVDELAKRSGISRADCIRDAIYTSVYQAMKAGEPLMRAPLVPYAQQYEDAPRLRLVEGRIRVADEYGFPTDLPFTQESHRE